MVDMINSNGSPEIVDFEEAAAALRIDDICVPNHTYVRILENTELSCAITASCHESTVRQMPATPTQNDKGTKINFKSPRMS